MRTWKTGLIGKPVQLNAALIGGNPAPQLTSEKIMTQHPEISVKSNRLHVILPVTIVSGVVVIILATLYRFEFGLILLGIGGLAIAGGGVIIAHRIGKLTVAGLIGVEQIKQERAKTQRMRLEATVIETRHGLIMPGGKFIPPTVSERRQLGLPAGDVIEGEATPTVDFYTAMLGMKQGYKIIAEQRRGKSYLAMHVTDRSLEKCLVIGTKYEPGEWPNAVKFLVDPERVIYGLEQIINETTKRNRTFQRSPVLRVFLDDWLNTVMLYPDLAREFLEIAATTMLTAGIVPYFLLQGDGNDDWGNKKSAALKNNFTGLWVDGPRDDNGDPIPSQNTAVIVYPGSREKLPVRLPRGLPRLGGRGLPVISRKPGPTAEEQLVLDTWRETESYRQTTMAAWRQHGKFYNERVDEILERWG